MPRSAIPALIKLLKEEDSGIRPVAAYALWQINPTGSEARIAISALIESLKDRQSSVREDAAFFLGCIGPDVKSSVPALTELLKDDDEDVRKAATEASEKIKKEK